MTKKNGYEFDKQTEIARKATTDIVAYLENKPETISVINVENDRQFQKMDVDILWIFKINGDVEMRKIEIKGDTYYKSGNFFLETHSNVEKGTPGCFMYSKADFIFYYFIDTGELTAMPMIRSRQWFIKNMERFENKRLKTVGKDGSTYYTTRGRIVSKKVMRDELGLQYKNIPTVHKNKNIQLAS